MFEILWIKTYIKNSECFIGGIYHPPKSIYNSKDLLVHLERTLEDIVTAASSVSPIIILAGDFNQLDNNDILNLGLQVALFAPTHKGHNLDRIYTSVPIYTNIKVITPTVITEHRAVLARSDSLLLVDHNKTKLTSVIRPHAPANHAALLKYLQTHSWQQLLALNDVQTATDLFYTTASQLLHTFYPTSTITTTSKDPPYMTPQIKRLLRKKNVLMRKGRTEEADAIRIKIRNDIIKHNSMTFKDTSARSCAKDMWDKVRVITGKSKGLQLPAALSSSGFAAEDFNIY